VKFLLYFFNQLRNEQIIEEADVLKAIDRGFKLVPEIALYIDMKEKSVRRVLSRLIKIGKVEETKYIGPVGQVVTVTYGRRTKHD